MQKASSTRPPSSALGDPRRSGPIRGRDTADECGWVIRPRRTCWPASDWRTSGHQRLRGPGAPPLPRRPIRNVVQIRRRRPRPSIAVVLGPGTGLGVAGLVYAQHTGYPCPARAAMSILAPRTRARLPELCPSCERSRTYGREADLSAARIMNLYSRVCAAMAREAVLADQAAVTTSALSGADAAAVETCPLATYLGRVPATWR